VLGQTKGGISKDLPLAQGGFSQSISSGIFSINGVHIAIDAGVDSLQGVIDKVNRSGAGVTASYDGASDRLVLVQKLDSNITAPRISLGDNADTSNFLEAMQLTVDTTVPVDVGSVRQSALLTVNGVTFERNSNTITDLLDKVSLTLNSVTTGPETISISADTERVTNALLDFLVEYNQSMELLNAQPLSREERRVTAELTDEMANSMTAAEITEYLDRRQAFLTRDFIAGDPSLRQMTAQIQGLVSGPVKNSGAYRSLSIIGLSTSAVGGGPAAAAVSQGRLLGPTSDREELRALLESSAPLRDAIENHSDDLFTLFSSAIESRYDHVGTRNLSGGVAVSTRLRFSFGDGKSSAQIDLGPGNYSQASLLNTLNTQITNSGLGSNVLAFFDAQNQLNFRSARSDRQAVLQLIDQSEGADSLQGRLGLTAGLFFGPDPNVSGGVARRTRQLLNTVTATGGVLLERIKQGGSFDRQIDGLTKQMSAVEERVAIRERNLRAKFARMEASLGQLQSQQSALSGAIAKLTSGG
jgi:flagellar hook-associated protein 2